MDEYPEYDFYNSGVEGDGIKRRRRSRWRKGGRGGDEEEGCNQHDSFSAALTGLQHFLAAPPTFCGVVFKQRIQRGNVRLLFCRNSVQ